MIKYEGTGYGLNPPKDWGVVTRTEGGESREYVVEPYSFEFSIDGQNYYFIPQSFLEKGRVTYGSQQYYLPSILKPDFAEKLQGQNVSVDQLGSEKFVRDLNKYYGDTQGLLVPEDTFKDLFTKVNYYDTATYQLNGVLQGPITGVGQRDNQNVYVTGASGRDNPQGWIDWNADEGKAYQNTHWYDPGNKFLRTLGYGLIAVGTGGLLGIGPLAGAATTTAAGTGIIPGAAGTTGLLPSAGGITGITAPAGFTLAPGIVAPVAGATLLEGANLSGMGQTGITPGAAGTGLNLPTTPSVSTMGGAQGVTVPVAGGTVTQAGLIPAGAVPVLGDPSSFINNPDVLGRPVIPTEAAGISATDALRALNQARGLLGAGQNPVVPRQPLAQRPRQGVDVLTLPQLTARTPGVSSLLAPTQLQARYQPTLLPNVFSLLG